MRGVQMESSGPSLIISPTKLYTYTFECALSIWDIGINYYLDHPTCLFCKDQVSILFVQVLVQSSHTSNPPYILRSNSSRFSSSSSFSSPSTVMHAKWLQLSKSWMNYLTNMAISKIHKCVTLEICYMNYACVTMPDASTYKTIHGSFI